MQFVTLPTISATFLERVRIDPDKVVFRYKDQATWVDVTFREFHDRCRRISYGLMGLDVAAGDRVAILSNTRYEWSLCDMAILGAKAVTVPVYPSNTALDAAFILNHSGAKVAIVEDAKQLEKILELRASQPNAIPALKHVVVIEPSATRLVGAPPESRSDESGLFLTLSDLSLRGEDPEERDPRKFEENLKSAVPDDLISICYTSGTTGVPKGAMITHDNMMSVLEDCVAVLPRLDWTGDETVLSFLPFSHILGKVESMAIYAFGWRQAFAENLDKLMTNMVEIRPTVIFTVPRIFEKGFARIQAAVAESSPLMSGLFAWGMAVGRRYYGAIWAGKSPSVRDTFEYAAARKLVFSKVHARFGGKLRFAICGGAPLPREIGEFFQIVGIHIMEGYGLTETCAPVAVNTLDAIRFGTVGRPLPEVTIKIAADGEILVRSRKVFKGYFGMPEETDAAVVDGWLHTGDIGHLDEDGYLHVTDRKKDLIITSGGKNIAPQKIENLAKAQSLFSHLVVCGDRRNYLTALITLDAQQVIQWATEKQILFSEYSELIKNPKAIALVQAAIDEINKNLAGYETIKKFVILPNEFTIESGELTPSLKIKRRTIAKRYQAELDGMYPDRAPTLDSINKIR